MLVYASKSFPYDMINGHDRYKFMLDNLVTRDDAVLKDLLLVRGVVLIRTTYSNKVVSLPESFFYIDNATVAREPLENLPFEHFMLKLGKEALESSANKEFVKEHLTHIIPSFPDVIERRGTLYAVLQIVVDDSILSSFENNLVNGFSLIDFADIRPATVFAELLADTLITVKERQS